MTTPATITASDVDSDGPTLLRPQPLPVVLRVPTGIAPQVHAHRLAAFWEAVLEEAGLAAYDRALLSEHATPADLVLLLRGKDLPHDSKLLAAIREAYPCT